MKITTDTKQRIKTCFAFGLEFYKILMGTFLVTFVPQKCDDRVCSITENINNTELYHYMGNISNLVTFIVVLGFYILEMNRENWSITYLDINPSLPNNNLDREIEYYPVIKKKMHKLNLWYLRMIYLCIIFLSVNSVISCIIIGNDYVGVNTFTSLVSFLILVASKFSNAIEIGSTSVKEERAFSAYLKIAKTYNTIDTDHRIQYNTYHPYDKSNKSDKSDNLSII
jgi:hypothetical protein